jgi:hypothetical protein
VTRMESGSVIEAAAIVLLAMHNDKRNTMCVGSYLSLLAAL